MSEIEKLFKSTDLKGSKTVCDPYGAEFEPVGWGFGFVRGFTMISGGCIPKSVSGLIDG
jgi:hypothetical protein